MIAIAEEAGVPMVEEVYVARRLHARTEVGDYIPAELFEPVAEILSLVNEMRHAEEGIGDDDLDDDEDTESDVDTDGDNDTDTGTGTGTGTDTDADTDTDTDTYSDTDTASPTPGPDGGVDPRGDSGRSPPSDPRRPADG
jgi:type III secretion protein U